ncbi:MAG: PAS domain S-box protein [Alphaproteobacteria bacterium]|nr:PAS domain S-box protein [Alphaproteobacteria bacterium]
MAVHNLLERIVIATCFGAAVFAVLILIPSANLVAFIHEIGDVIFALLLISLLISLTLLFSFWEWAKNVSTVSKDQQGENFLLAMQGASDGLWVWDIEKDEVKITPRINEVLGTNFPLDGITSRQLFSTFHRDDRDELSNEILRHMRGETDFFVFEYRAIQPDGSVRWVEDRGVAERDENGKAIRIGGSVTEISYRKEAESQILKSEHLLQAVLNNTPAIVFIKDTDFRYILANRQYLNIFELSLDDVRGKTDYDLYPPEFADEYRKKDLHVRDNLKLLEYEVVIPQGDGPHTYISGKFPLLNEKGELYAICGVAVDITDRINAEKALAQHKLELESTVEKRTRELVVSQERFKDFAEIGADWFWETGPDHIYTYISPTIEDITGTKPKDLYKVNRRQLGAPEDLSSDPEKWESHFADLDAHRPFSRFEYLYNAPNGQKLYLRISGRPYFSENGVFAGYRGVGSNVTEEQVAALALNAAKEEADRANRAKSEFLSRMSHELRTPLNGILGFAQLLELETENHLTEKQFRFVSDIRKAGDHLLDLINEVLDLAKIESGGLKVLHESFDPTDVMKECIGMVAPLASKNGIRLVDAVVPDRDGLFVYSDRTRLKQVVVNLLSNGIKYNRVNGSVTLSIGQEKPDFYRFKVTDTGLGIPKDKLEEIFRPFTRLEVPGGASEGTGIGLAITKKLVELMGGTIGLESTYGDGSSFWVDLPLSNQERIPATEEKAEETLNPVNLVTDGKKLILYVEDNPANLRLMETILTRIPDIELITAETGEEGIREAKTHHPDLIILDINLPGIDGIETLKILKKTNGMETTPILALSAAAMQEDVRKGLDAGFDAYLTKPLDVRATLTAISEALGD